MPIDDDITFTLREAIVAQQAIRSAIGLQPEVFPLHAFIGMISDEIEQSRKAGRNDQAIVDVIREATGKVVSLEALCAFYAPPEQRLDRGGDR